MATCHQATVGEQLVGAGDGGARHLQLRRQQPLGGESGAALHLTRLHEPFDGLREPLVHRAAAVGPVMQPFGQPDGIHL